MANVELGRVTVGRVEVRPSRAGQGDDKCEVKEGLGGILDGVRGAKSCNDDDQGVLCSR